MRSQSLCLSIQPPKRVAVVLISVDKKYSNPRAEGLTRSQKASVHAGFAKQNLTVDGVMKRDGETLQSLNKELAKNKPSYLGFNGKELSWIEDEKKAASWKGMSGKLDYQCKEYTSTKDKGPLPEGKWLLRQARQQNYDESQNTMRKKI